MITPTDSIDTIQTVHDRVRRMEESAAHCYEDWAVAARALSCPQAAETWASLAAAARRRARDLSADGTAPLPAAPPPDSADMPPIALSEAEALELALDMEYALLAHLDVLKALGETQAIRDEVMELVQRKRLHLAELAARQDQARAVQGLSVSGSIRTIKCRD